MTSPPAIQRGPPPGNTGDSTHDEIEARLIPDEVEVALFPLQDTTAAAASLWHRVQPPPGTQLSLLARGDRSRRVRCSVQGASPGWQPRWARWSFAVRRLAEAVGGDAASAQDQTGDEALSLTLLLLPNDDRTVNLDFHIALDGASAPGDYAFLVLVTELETRQEWTVPGLLRLRHPPAAYLSYLPIIYSETREKGRPSVSWYEEPPFFERYLRGFEDSMMPLQALLAGLFQYFDPDTTPAEFLPWLATWVSLVLDENWPELKRRQLIREAVQLFRWRGTRRGLTRYLEIYAGVRPTIEDQPVSGMVLGPAAQLGSELLLGGVSPHCFVVTIALPEHEAINEQVMREIIEAQKPAHTAYALRIVRRAASDW